VTAFDKLALEKALESLNDVCASICTELKGAGNQRIKRIREVLKAAEKLLEFSKFCSCTLSTIDELSEVTAKLEAEHESEAVQKICEKLTVLIGDVTNNKSSVNDKSAVSHDADDDEEMEDDDEIQSNSKSSSKQKKKKKKKRGKK